MIDLETEYVLLQYKEVGLISSNDRNKVFTVQKVSTGEMFIKKVFPIDTDIEVYRQLKSKNLKNIPKIYEILEDTKGKYVIEEYISGQSSDKLLAKQGKITPDTVLSWTVSLCDTLKQLHNCNPSIIHRDIKPSNIMVTPDNTVKLIDFDISRNFKPRSDKDTRIIGTDYYISPEQHGSGQTDNRSDIFSIGKMMATLLTGKQLPLKDVAPSLGRLRIIIEKCCEIDPARRYQNVSQLKRALFLNEYRFIKPSVFIIALVLCGFIAYKLIPQMSVGNNDVINYGSEVVIPTPTIGITPVYTDEPMPTSFESTAEEHDNNTPALLDDNDNIESSIQSSEPYKEVISNAPIEQMQDTSIDAIESAEPFKIQSVQEPINEPSDSNEQSTELTKAPQMPVKYTSVSIQGKVLGITADNKEIVSCTNEGVFITNISNNSEKQAVSFSPNLVWGSITASDKGLSKIAVRFNTGKDLGIYDVVSGQCVEIISKTNHEAFAFTNDGKLLITIGTYDSKGNVSATVFNTETRTIINEFMLSDRVSQIAVHPYNNEIALFYFGGTCQIRNIETFDLICNVGHDAFNNTNSTYGLCYSDNGNLLLLTDYDNTYVIDAVGEYKIINTIPNPSGYYQLTPVFVGNDRFILGNRLYYLDGYTYIEFENVDKNILPTNDLTYLFYFENWNLSNNNCVIYKWNIKEY